MSQLIERVLRINEEASRRFVEGLGERLDYQAEHSTVIISSMCMDGRVNPARKGKIPVGIIRPFRNIGGIYDLGWPLMARSIAEIEAEARRECQGVLFLVTYHWSEGNQHLGCRGFKYDRVKAIERMRLFHDQIVRVYGKRIFPVLLGIETDSRAFVVHGKNGNKLDIRDCLSAGPDFLRVSLRQLFPEMDDRTLEDFLPMLVGNILYVKATQELALPQQAFQHCEWTLALGQGFDWMENNNDALIVGPCDPDLNVPIVTAAGILHENHTEGRIGPEGVLLTVMPYRGHQDKGMAVEQARYLSRFGFDSIRRERSDIGDFFHPLTAVLRLKDRRLEVID